MSFDVEPVVIDVAAAIEPGVPLVWPDVANNVAFTVTGGAGVSRDTVVARLIDFSIAARGQAPVPWSWLDLGSAARREFTLASDQDNGLAYADPEPGAEEAVDGYFAPKGDRLVSGHERAACVWDVATGKALQSLRALNAL